MDEMDQTVAVTLEPQTRPAGRVFPIAGTNLARLLNEPDFKRTFHARLKTYNPWMVAFYRIGLLPLFGAARTVMLLITRGRKSGAVRYTPIGYFRIGGVIHIFSAWGKSSQWYKNLAANPDDVAVQIGWRRQPVRVQAMEDPAEIQRTLAQFVAESPEEAAYLFGWDAGRDRIEDADFSPIIENVLIIRWVATPSLRINSRADKPQMR
jgi:deazaflavin-dependent oxidoreductase (nitroreductase family)